MKKNLFASSLILLFTFISLNSFAQKIEWSKCYGGSEDEDVTSIVATKDGGYIIAGQTSSNDSQVTGNHGGTDAWVVKIDKNGAIEWQKCYGDSFYNYANSITQTSDGGYIFAGVSHNSAWIVKIKNNGDIDWQKMFGGSMSEYPHSIKQTLDGGYIFAGATNSNDGDVSGNHGIYDSAKKMYGYYFDAWVVKLKSNGDMDWQKCYGSDSDDGASSIIQTSDSGYIFAGNTTANNGDVSGYHGGSFIAGSLAFGKGDYWVVKLKKDGSIDWEKTYGGSNDDWASAIIQTRDSGYMVIGTAISSDDDLKGKKTDGLVGYNDPWVVKLKINGDIDWSRCYGGWDNDFGDDVIQTSDGGYALSGQVSGTESWIEIPGTAYHAPGGNNLWNAYVAKINNDGSLNWHRSYGGIKSSQASSEAVSIIETADGALSFAGFTSSSNDGDVVNNHGYDIGDQFTWDAWVVKIGEDDTLIGKVTTSTGAALKNSKVYLGVFNPSDTTVIARDSVLTDSMGNYAFIAFDSVVHLEAFPNASYPHEIPTWADTTADFFASLDLKLHHGTNIKNFHTLYGANPGGTGVIGGKIVLCFNCKTYGSGLPAAHVRVMLADSNGAVQQSTWTDAGGHFSFQNIAITKYKIWVDEPMVDNRATAPMVSLSSANTMDTGLKFTLYPSYLSLDKSAGIEKQYFSSANIRIYPNPSTGSLNIDFENAISETNISILDLQGRELITSKIPANSMMYQTNVSNLPQGMYMIKLQNKEGVIMQKFLKN